MSEESATPTTSTPSPESGPSGGPDTSAVFAAYLERTRWFGGKGRPFSVVSVRSLGELPGGPPLVVIDLVEIEYADAQGGTEIYQVPLACYEHPEHRLDHAFIGWWEDPEHGWVHAYDALHDREAMALWQRAFADAVADESAAPAEPTATAGPSTADHGVLRFHRLPGHDLDLAAHSTLFSGEQSNSSVAFGEDALMKVFRKVTPGINPDISVHEVLTRAGSAYVAPLFGWVEARLEQAGGDGGDGGDGEVLQLAMLQAFLRTATDGWDLALASVRTLYTDPFVHAWESGGDFSGESARLGEALREVHSSLAAHFPAPAEPQQPAGDLAEVLTGRLDTALEIVPELEAHADTLRALYAQVADLGTVGVQQIHGDLHLGQTLRTSVGWKIVDFEGEPAKTLAERQLPDSPWRDVAGMLRSFDYAPRVVERSMGTAEDDQADQITELSREWAERNERYFLTAYAGGDLTAEQRILLDAYVADKAVYETIYETRNRPSWVAIPLQAVARIGAP